jgi:hypothetical protein
MNRFDKRVKQILNEGILSAIGAGLKAAKDPGRGLLDMAAKIGERGKVKEAMVDKPLSPENPPKKNNQIVYTKSSVLKLDVAKNKFFEILPKETIILGKITNKQIKNGLYRVELVDIKQFFGQTPNTPYWQIYDSTVPDNVFSKDSAGNPMKRKFIDTGLALREAIQPLREWRDYEQFRKQSKNPKK